MADIRREIPADQLAIYNVTQRAFEGRPYAGGDEQDVINRLREQNSLVLSLVIEEQGQILGQISFSPATLSDDSGPWFALGPVAVLPEHQGRGLGGQLITHGLKEIKSQGALGCILTGNPDYYRRFGFELAPKHVPNNEPAEYFMLHTFGTQSFSGTFRFHPAFYG